MHHTQARKEACPSPTPLTRVLLKSHVVEIHVEVLRSLRPGADRQLPCGLLVEGRALTRREAIEWDRDFMPLAVAEVLHELRDGDELALFLAGRATQTQRERLGIP